MRKRWPARSRVTNHVERFEIGAGAPLALIAGPCVIESEEHVHFLAREIARSPGRSSSKLPSTKPTGRASNSYRGPGLKEGLRILKVVRDAGFPVLTDIHEPSQAAEAAEAVDILQIPAFLCRQTDLLVEAGAHRPRRQYQEGPIRRRRTIFVSPRRRSRRPAMIAIHADRARQLVRLQQSGRRHARARHHARVRLAGGVRRDAQRAASGRGGNGVGRTAASSSSRWLARAVAAGVDAVFVEVHEAPERALSDGANALRLDLLGRAVAKAATDQFGLHAGSRGSV